MAQELAELVQAAERACEAPLVGDDAFCVRLDGHGFSSFTKGFRKPFDPRLHTAMVHASIEMCAKFPDISTAYTTSDEVTFVFRPRIAGGAVFCGGRPSKILSHLAASFSIEFNLRLASAGFSVDDGDSALVVDRVESYGATFDARIIAGIDPNDAIKWRHAYSCFRNGVQSFAQSKFSHAELQGKKLKEMIEMIGGLEAVPPELLWGSFVKREQYTNEQGATRTRYLTKVLEKTPDVLSRCW
jgi:tRNA(His) 5'-end guanylyltransferase